MHCVPSICADSKASLRTYIARYIEAFGTNLSIPSSSPIFLEQALSSFTVSELSSRAATFDSGVGTNEEYSSSPVRFFLRKPCPLFSIFIAHPNDTLKLLKSCIVF